MQPTGLHGVPGSDERLINHDLAPITGERKNWSSYSIFAMWMSDIHSVGGYTFAASRMPLCSSEDSDFGMCCAYCSATSGSMPKPMDSATMNWL